MSDAYRRFWGANDRESTECADCGVLATAADEFHVHHEDGRGFVDDLDNLVGLCAECHYARHEDLDTVTTVDEWKAAFEDELA